MNPTRLNQHKLNNNIIKISGGIIFEDYYHKIYNTGILNTISKKNQKILATLDGLQESFWVEIREEQTKGGELWLKDTAQGL